jgi:hypothetical protein
LINEAGRQLKSRTLDMIAQLGTTASGVCGELIKGAERTSWRAHGRLDHRSVRLAKPLRDLRNLTAPALTVAVVKIHVGRRHGRGGC